MDLAATLVAKLQETETENVEGFPRGWHSCGYCSEGEIEWDRLETVIREAISESS